MPPPSQIVPRPSLDGAIIFDRAKRPPKGRADGTCSGGELPLTRPGATEGHRRAYAWPKTRRPPPLLEVERESDRRTGVELGRGLSIPRCAVVQSRMWSRRSGATSSSPTVVG